MSGTMHLDGLYTDQANFKRRTRVKYTQASGLPDWSGNIVGEIVRQSSFPYYTTQIPNVQDAEEIQIGDNVTSIGYMAFHNCTKLINVIIPNSVTSIGGHAFYSCNNLTSVTIPNSVTSIEGNTFYNCKRLTNITIPNSVTSIGYASFQICYGLTNLTIPDGVTSIGGHAFRDCNNLTNVIFPANVTNIYNTAFQNCSACTIFDFRKSTSVPTLAGVDAFYNTSADKEIIVPDSLYDSWIAASNWSSSTNNIVNCIVKASESSLGVLERTTQVKYTASSGRSNWCGDIIGPLNESGSSPTTQIPNVTDAERIYIGNGVTSIGQNTFNSCSNLNEIEIARGITTIGARSFQGCTGLKNIIIPPTVETIGLEAFKTCSGLREITIPDKVTNIPTGTFNTCGGLISVTIGSGVTSMGAVSFEGCDKLKRVTIPDNVTSIINNAFRYCENLKSVIFGSGMASISGGAFMGCSNCSIFDFRRTASVPALANVDAFYDTPSVKEIIVPDSLYDDWIAASNWSSDTYQIRPSIVKASLSSLGVLYPTKVRYTQESGLADAEVAIVGAITGAVSDENYRTQQIPNLSNAKEIELGQDVTSIGVNTFKYCYSLTDVTIPNSVTSVGNSAFYGSNALTNVIIGTGVTEISFLAFAYCSALTSIRIPDDVISIGYSAFMGCSSLEGEFIFPDRMSSIQVNTLYGCSNLTSVTIGSGISNIEARAFYGCSSCTIFDFRKSTSVPTLATVDAFYDTPSNKEIIVPDSLYDSWIAADIWSSSAHNIVNCIVKASQSSLGPLT